MPDDPKSAAVRFEIYARDVLRPAVYGPAEPLEVAAFQCPEPVSYEEALEAAYESVVTGWRWGPAWSTAPPRLAALARAVARDGRLDLAPELEESFARWFDPRLLGRG